MTQSDDITMTFKKDDLLAKLRALRPALVKADVKAEAQHKKDEVAFMAKFKAALKVAAKWDYTQAKNNHFSLTGFRSYDRPECPTKLADRLDRVISQVETSPMQRWVITPGGKYERIHQLLTIEAKQPKVVC